jgi:TetR/AcrR family transcriptional repressor of nem operon
MGRPRTFDESDILEKAANLFWEKGYAGTSVQDLVDHLGISRASLYNVYADKDALYMEALSRYQKVSQQAVREVFQNHPDVRKGLETLFMGSAQVSDKHPAGCMMVNCTVERALEDEGIFSFLRKNKKAFLKVMKEYLASGVASGQLSSTLDLDAVAGYLYVFYNGLNVDLKLKPAKEKVRQMIGLALRVLED